MRDRPRLRPLRRSAGLLWLAAWTGLLYTVASPWGDLGGVVDERLRWLVWYAVVVGPSVGFAVGRYGRETAERGAPTTHLSVLRRFLYPVAALAAAWLVVLVARERHEPVGVVVTALLAYWAGIDLAFGAVPLIEGRSYRFRSPPEPEPESEPEPGDPAGSSLPPWGLR